MDVAEAIGGRRSIRAFRDTPVARETVERILTLSARAPSGSNTQPWRAYAMAGAARDALCAEVQAAHLAGDAGDREYLYYPEPWFEPYLARRRQVGWALYGTLGITKGDTARMQAQHGRNFAFFGAPVGLVITIDRRLNPGSWLDLGMFVQNMMLAARGEGLETCPQAAFAPYHQIIRRHLPIMPEEMVVCGMALGEADWDAPENGLVTERAPLADWAQFHGWD